MKCKIRILTSAPQGRELFEGEGEYSLSDGVLCVAYEADGDPCELVFNCDRIVQRHGGKINLEISFTEGRTSLCSFSDGNLSGGYEIYTRKLSLSKRAGGVYLARVLWHPAEDKSHVTDVSVGVFPQKQ